MTALFLVVSVSNSGCRCSPRQSEIVSKGGSVYQKVTGDDVESDRTQWDQVFDREGYVFGKEPVELLRQYVDVLPLGKALDIAMSEGRNAVFLARKGFVVDGVDISEVAIRKARRLARESRVEINAIRADLNTYAIAPDSYEVIVNVDYLQRDLIPKIKKGLKRGGVVVFENATEAQLQLPGGEGLARDSLLKEGELKTLFSEFKVIFYEELNDGTKALARLIAVKP